MEYSDRDKRILARAIEENSNHNFSSFFPTRITVERHAAMLLAHEQHKPGNWCKVGRDYRVHYYYPDGAEVPGYDYFLKVAKGR